MIDAARAAIVPTRLNRGLVSEQGSLPTHKLGMSCKLGDALKPGARRDQYTTDRIPSTFIPRVTRAADEGAYHNSLSVSDVTSGGVSSLASAVAAIPGVEQFCHA